MSGSKTARISSTTSSSAKSALVELASSSSASPSSNAAARRVETTSLATASPSALLSKSAQRLDAGVGHTRDLRQAAPAPGQRHGSLPGHAPRASRPHFRERTSLQHTSPGLVLLSAPQPAERCSVRQGRFRVAPSHCCTVAPLNQGECAHISLPLNLPSLDLCAHFAGCCKSPRTHPKNVRTFRTRPKVRTNGPALARWRGKKCAHISRERAEREGNVRTFAGSAVQAVRQCNSATVRPAHTRRPA